jgi:hypothetical protein
MRYSYTTLSVDKQRLRQFFSVELLPDSVVSDGNLILHMLFGHEWEDVIGSFSVHVDSYHDKSFITIFLVELHIPGNFDDASSAIDGPEVQEDYFASIV